MKDGGAVCMIEPISTKEYLWGVFLWRVRPVLISSIWILLAWIVWEVLTIWHMTFSLPVVGGLAFLDYWHYSHESDSDGAHSERYTRWINMHRWLKVTTKNV